MKPIGNEGQRMLAAIPESLVAIGKRVGTSKTNVFRWKTGEALPSLEARELLQHAYKIPVEAWTRIPGAEGREAGSASASELAKEFPTAYSQCIALLSTIVAARKADTTTSVERIKLADSEARILRLRAQLEERAELAEDRYVREHPAWIRVKHELARVLTKYPEAARAVAEALERLDL